MWLIVLVGDQKSLFAPREKKNLSVCYFYRLFYINIEDVIQKKKKKK